MDSGHTGNSLLSVRRYGYFYILGVLHGLSISTAHVILSGPKNIKAVTKSIQKQLGGLNTSINIPGS